MLDARTLTRLERAFDLQMWAFGCDARCPTGNLFAARGMRRTPAPPGSALSSTWAERWGEGELELSTLGLRLTRDGHALLLQRGPLGPQLREAPTALLADAARWILEWEAWVDERQGPAWRDETLKARRRPAPFNVEGLRAQWAAVTNL